MKRLMIGLIATTLMALGLVGISESASSAACPSYTGCVPTRTYVSAKSPVAKHHKGKVCVAVWTAGSGKPKGRVTIAVFRSAGGFGWSMTKRYRGGKTCVTTPRLHKKGQYLARGTFYPYAISVFGPSRNVDTFRVKSRRWR